MMEITIAVLVICLLIAVGLGSYYLGLEHGRNLNPPYHAPEKILRPEDATYASTPLGYTTVKVLGYREDELGRMVVNDPETVKAALINIMESSKNPAGGKVMNFPSPQELRKRHEAEQRDAYLEDFVGNKRKSGTYAVDPETLS